VVQPTSSIRAVTGTYGFARIGCSIALLPQVNSSCIAAEPRHLKKLPIPSSRLRAFQLFTGLPEKDVAEIAKACEERRIPAGTLMIRQGQVGKELFLLEEGDAAVFKKTSDPDRQIAVLHGPEIVGEQALMDPERIRTANVAAVTNLRVMAIEIATFIEFLRRHPVLGSRIKQMIHERMRAASARKIG